MGTQEVKVDVTEDGQFTITQHNTDTVDAGLFVNNYETMKRNRMIKEKQIEELELQIKNMDQAIEAMDPYAEKVKAAWEKAEKK